MFVDFLFQLRAARVPATIREFLMLMEAMSKGVAGASVDDFYYLSRAALVKDEKYYDMFDRVFANFFCAALPICHHFFRLYCNSAGHYIVHVFL